MDNLLDDFRSSSPAVGASLPKAPLMYKSTTPGGQTSFLSTTSVPSPGRTHHPHVATSPPSSYHGSNELSRNSIESCSEQSSTNNLDQHRPHDAKSSSIVPLNGLSQIRDDDNSNAPWASERIGGRLSINNCPGDGELSRSLSGPNYNTVQSEISSISSSMGPKGFANEMIRTETTYSCVRHDSILDNNNRASGGAMMNQNTKQNQRLNLRGNEELDQAVRRHSSRAAIITRNYSKVSNGDGGRSGSSRQDFPKLALSHDPVSDVNLTLQYLCRNILDETVILDNGFTRDRQGPQTIYRCQCILVLTSCSLSKILDFKQRQTDKSTRPYDAQLHRMAFVNSIKSHCQEMSLDEAVKRFHVSDMVRVNLLNNLSKAQNANENKGADLIRTAPLLNNVNDLSNEVTVFVHTEDGGHDKKKREAKRKACQELLSTLRRWVFEGMPSNGPTKNVRGKVDLLRGLPNVREESSYDGGFLSNDQKSSVKREDIVINEMHSVATDDDSRHSQYYSLCLNGDRELKDVIAFVRDQRLQQKKDPNVPYSRCQCRLSDHLGGFAGPKDSRSSGVPPFIPTMELEMRAALRTRIQNPMVGPSNPYQDHQNAGLCFIPPNVTNAPPHPLSSSMSGPPMVQRGLAMFNQFPGPPPPRSSMMTNAQFRGGVPPPHQAHSGPPGHYGMDQGRTDNRYNMPSNPVSGLRPTHSHHLGGTPPILDLPPPHGNYFN